ncbi:MAG: hypothetical protein H6500_01065 [Candidatus Woesearchaeota archaeon]|nr:hypothetical protein [Nanoarchaeota archaeon]USN44422.1 MAG: hypothetical protein H6500_01065 [Candidatus Woesearchaeota archaeon]
MKTSTESFIAFFLLVSLVGISLLVSSQTKPVSLCNSDDSCIFKLVSETKDERLCEKATNKSQCYLQSALLLERANTCLYVEEHDICVMQVAFKTGNLSFCQATDDKDLCVYSYAYAKNDKTLCSQSGKYEQSCLTKLAEKND